MEHARSLKQASPAAHGYDVRAEVFGSAGMVTAGSGASTAMMLRDATGLHQETARGDVELMGDAYTAEFIEFVAAIQQARQPYVTGHDARRALAVALACIESVQTRAPITMIGPPRRWRDDGRVQPGRLCGDDLH